MHVKNAAVITAMHAAKANAKIAAAKNKKS
jgi:hypothetical protein